MVSPSLSSVRRQGPGITSRIRRLTAAIGVVMAAGPAALMIAATPAAAHPAEGGVAAAPSGSAAAEVVIRNSWFEFLGARAGANLTVWSDHEKNIWICDDSAADGVGLGIEVDPSGPQDPIIYYNTAASGCLEHEFWYSVRKFRFIVVNHDGSVNDNSNPWIMETPFPDF
ncbi:hypothetical protein [Actinomadura livida]|uniref:Uncharacterized protein n=1 Tax=Actinomadura livida TaxID=79909 RepID=A0A7W7ID19_9ACTN|nr:MULTISPECIES: hypothetical protein [Actinomadura]MBB4774795.1 hypothetical protein [Actinomadura catellatispora]GGU05956.1 hypothetical protein GCM10010208_32780 [Actinomadura livida]